MRQQAEMIDIKVARQTLDKLNRTLKNDLEDTKCHLKEVQTAKIEVLKELEVVRRERNFMSESMKELQLLLFKKVDGIL